MVMAPITEAVPCAQYHMAPRPSSAPVRTFQRGGGDGGPRQDREDCEADGWDGWTVTGFKY